MSRVNAKSHPRFVKEIIMACCKKTKSIGVANVAVVCGSRMSPAKTLPLTRMGRRPNAPAAGLAWRRKTEIKQSRRSPAGEYIQTASPTRSVRRVHSRTRFFARRWSWAQHPYPMRENVLQFVLLAQIPEGPSHCQQCISSLMDIGPAKDLRTNLAPFQTF